MWTVLAPEAVAVLPGTETPCQAGVTKSVELCPTNIHQLPILLTTLLCAPCDTIHSSYLDVCWTICFK